jgi:hypothetical protein
MFSHIWSTKMGKDKKEDGELRELTDREGEPRFKHVADDIVTIKTVRTYWRRFRTHGANAWHVEVGTEGKVPTIDMPEGTFLAIAQAVGAERAKS